MYQARASLPSWERGLKSCQLWKGSPLVLSLPSWERGLKSDEKEDAAYWTGVAPLVGAWIEMREINEVIRAAIPEAREKISWSMPTYWKKRNLIQFAAFKNHVGLYPGPEAVEKFVDRLTGYQTQKGTIRLPYDQPLDRELVAEIAVWCEKENGK